MFKYELEKGSYYDFVLTNDCRSYETDLTNCELLNINVVNTLCDEKKGGVSETTLLENISLTGYDNFFISPENSLTDVIINPDIEYQLTTGDTFCFHEVSGYTQNLTYDIEYKERFNLLKGGFYQGFFKLFGYPVEFFPSRMRKGWSINMLIYNTSGDTINEKQTLNDIFDNSGFIFYLGTRAENKFSDLTEVEVNVLENEYSFNFLDTNNLFTRNYFMVNGSPYTGYFNYRNGIPYIGRTFDSNQSVRLEYNNKYKDIINNAFGVRITPEGKIGYRTIYSTDPCYTGYTQDISGITNNSFIDYSRDCDDFTIGKIITKYFTIEESYTKNKVIDLNSNEFNLISVVFERDFILNGKCQLKYNEYKKGTLSIYINGFRVYKNYNFYEIIPHELDTESKYQEGVPFNISFGGGTQGLYEAVYLDDGIRKDDILSKFFAGTFDGGVVSIQMFCRPLYVTDIRKLLKDEYNLYEIFQPKGGRRVFLKSLEPSIVSDIYSIYATSNSIMFLNKIQINKILIGQVKQITLAAEKDGFKQTFDIPTSYKLKGIKYFNYITNKFEEEDKLDDFTISDFSRDGVNYKRYTHNKSDRGEVIIKLFF